MLESFKVFPQFYGFELPTATFHKGGTLYGLVVRLPTLQWAGPRFECWPVQPIISNGKDNFSLSAWLQVFHSLNLLIRYQVTVMHLLRCLIPIVTVNNKLLYEAEQTLWMSCKCENLYLYPIKKPKGLEKARPSTR